MELWQFFGYLHPKLVQFPLVLLLMGLIFDAVGLLRRSERFHWAAKILSATGTVFLLFAFICGIYAEIWAARAGVPQDAIEWHEFLANVASWGFVILTAWRLFLDADRRKSLTIYTGVGLSYYSLLGVTAYLGGSLVFNYGAAVVGARANTILSLHDLNNLATRQTDLNLKYSELMHHIFGYLTFALSGSLLATALFPKRADKLRWIGPLLLLLGGIFLFFCADLDLYRLTDWHQLRDREVQLHKSIAIVLTVIGAAGLLRKSHKKERAVSAASQQSKIIAVMALIGGGLLFTHVHTVAPYANVAAGVYIAHVCMGIVALSIGASRLLQDGFPQFKRAFAISFALFMCVESVLLVTYNEGLPWYIGYGRYNRWGPHEGTIAPYGPIRAELTFDNKDQAMDLYVLDRFNDHQPVGVPAENLNLIVSQGYEDLAIPLARVAESATSAGNYSHFRGLAPALRDIPGFCARLALPVGSQMKTGYFDPWVTPVIKWIPPNEVARYQCPMHEGVLSEKPGDCPLCGMPMVPIQRGPRTTLHDEGYDMALATEPQHAAVSDIGLRPPDVKAIDDRTLRLTFTPQFQGHTLRDLALVHEHLLHLIVVSQDLSFFDHIHPLMQADGALSITYAFPHAGHFLLFADITPRGQRSQVFRFPVTVGSTGSEQADSHADLVPSPTLYKPLESDPTITAELIPQPRTISAGVHIDLLFRLSRNGQPLTDIEPYLGAMGHCVIISQDTNTYLHCHPEQLFTPTKDTRGGPFVAFHTMFPAPGRYKIWAQFQRKGKILIAGFVIDVQSPLLPPKLINFILDD
ncbi:MAG TPA: DUF2231 domain-containing protein [Tepidisphaeraceae bacterium]|jgi:uncharacterized membrane protein|nr:DUF2231 domain-containing protein [Tepidisphaeraceae bacterium]